MSSCARAIRTKKPGHYSTSSLGSDSHSFGACSPEEHRKIAGFLGYGFSGYMLMHQSIEVPIFTFFHVKWDPEVGSNLFVRNTWFDSGYEYCVSHGAFGGYFRIFYVQVVLGP